MRQKLTSTLSGKSNKTKIVFLRLMRISIRRTIYALLFVLIVFTAILFIPNKYLIFDNKIAIIKNNLMEYASYFNKENPLIVRNIMLSGVNNFYRDEIIDASQIKLGDPILSIDIHEIKKKLDKIRWVKNTNIYRILPNTIHIEIQEYIPIALWQDKNQEVYLLDKKGEIIEKLIHDKFKNLIIVNAKEPNRYINDIMPIILNNKNNIIKNIDMANLKGQRRWNLKFKNGLVIKLPDNNILEKWNIFIKYNNKYNIIDANNIQYIDLRLDNKIIVKRL